ncbi:MAG: hypothetical protein AB7O97_17980 [Planctomycetota bacterium]
MNCKQLPYLVATVALLTAGLVAQKVVKEKPEEAAPQPVEVDHAVGRGGNSWFPVTEQDFGTHYNHDTVVGRFTFKNPTGDEVEWRGISGSCQCSDATLTVGDELYRYKKKPTPKLVHVIRDGGVEREEQVEKIMVGPEESGEVEVHMELGGVAGARKATLDIHTTDPKLPMIRLAWSAIGAQVFVISPSEVNLNQMVWNETREFTVTVQSPIQKDFEITGEDIAQDEFQVTRTKEMLDGTAKWTIQGTYSPKNAEALGGGVLKFYTDVPGQASFTVRVSAAIQGPLEVKPGTFLTLGMIRKGTKRVEQVVFEPNDGVELDATDIRIEKLTIDPKYVVTRKSKDGEKLVVEIEVTADAPSGLLRGDLIVDLNHPAVKTKKILFNGFVR